MSKPERQARPWQPLASGLSRFLLFGVLFAVNPAGADPKAAMKEVGRMYLDCVTETTEEYAGVEFKYTIDEAANTVSVIRWGEATDVKFGPAYITYQHAGHGTEDECLDQSRNLAVHHAA